MGLGGGFKWSDRWTHPVAHPAKAGDECWLVARRISARSAFGRCAWKSCNGRHSKRVNVFRGGIHYDRFGNWCGPGAWAGRNDRKHAGMAPAASQVRTEGSRHTERAVKGRGLTPATAEK